MISFRFGIYLSIIAIGVIIALVRFRKLNKAQQYLGWLLLSTLISEIISRVLAVKIRNSSPVYHFYSPIELLFLALILCNISKSSSNKRLITWLFVAAAIF